ncbi:hypothetical protein B566_EDAN000924 [Ephemera danica]|nr:hypothetical protein B566_EDAN000924 [Ephemera danica]
MYHTTCCEESHLLAFHANIPVVCSSGSEGRGWVLLTAGLFRRVFSLQQSEQRESHLLMWFVPFVLLSWREKAGRFVSVRRSLVVRQPVTTAELVLGAWRTSIFIYNTHRRDNRHSPHKLIHTYVVAEPGNIMAHPSLVTRCLRVFIATVALISVTCIFVLIPAITPPQSWTVQQDLQDYEQLTTTTIPMTPPVPPPSIDDFERLIDLNAFKFLKNVDPMTCNNQTFLIFIHSAPENVEKRSAIRYTSNRTVQQVLNVEQVKYNDIVQACAR